MLEHFSSQEGESYVDILVEGTACSHYLRIRLTKMGVPFLDLSFRNDRFVFPNISPSQP